MTEAAAVHRDDELRPHRRHLIYCTFSHAITLYEAIRNKGLHRGKAKARKGIKQQCRRTEAVDIIIAINHDCFAPLVRLHQAIHRRLHLGEQEWIGLGIIIGVQKLFSGCSLQAPRC